MKTFPYIQSWKFDTWVEMLSRVSNKMRCKNCLDALGIAQKYMSGFHAHHFLQVGYQNLDWQGSQFQALQHSGVGTMICPLLNESQGSRVVPTELCVAVPSSEGKIGPSLDGTFRTQTDFR